MIQSLKDLERLLKLCRKQGVTEITTSEVSFKLGDTPVRHQQNADLEDEPDQLLNFDEPLTPEELVQFANGGN